MGEPAENEDSHANTGQSAAADGRDQRPSQPLVRGQIRRLHAGRRRGVAHRRGLRTPVVAQLSAQGVPRHVGSDGQRQQYEHRCRQRPHGERRGQHGAEQRHHQQQRAKRESRRGQRRRRVEVGNVVGIEDHARIGLRWSRNAPF
ncbi:MAG: hypothetical protein KDB14_25305 [Planctomycetales bacterium]|nr:hypothetical protein [Planctomycetales bacterium]